MRKRNSGPPLKLSIPKFAGCGRCKKTGIEKPFLHEMVCDGCGGAGMVNKETGERVPDDILLVAMRKEIFRLRGIITEINRKDPDQCPIYGELGTRNGGKVRGD